MSDQQDWLYTDSQGNQQGPVSADELQQLGAAGAIHAETNVWTEGLEEWIPASQVEGLVPPAQTPHEEAAPAHQPQINLGAGSGIHLESTIQACPMGQSLTTQYSQSTTAKSPAKKIIFSLIAVAAIGTGIYFATTSGDETSDETPGLEEYTEANDRVSASPNLALFGNSQDALTIGKNFMAAIDPRPTTQQTEEESTQEEHDSAFNDDLHQPVSKSNADAKSNADTKGTPGTEPAKESNKPAKKEKLILSLHCHTLDQNNQKSVVLLIKIPNLHELDAEAKKSLASRAWVSAKLSLANTPYSDAKTSLVVALRGLTTYDQVMIGNPLMTLSPDKQPTEGMSKTHQGKDAEQYLYPYFNKKK